MVVESDGIGCKLSTMSNYKTQHQSEFTEMKLHGRPSAKWRGGGMGHQFKACLGCQLLAVKLGTPLKPSCFIPKITCHRSC